MSNKTEKCRLVPRRRFPEFCETGEWEKKELREVATILNKKAGSKKYRLMSITAGVGLVSQLEKFGREIAGAQYKNYLVIEDNDFAYNKSATKEYPEGFIGLYSGNEPGAVPNSIFTCFRVNEGKVSPKYLDYLFLGNLHGKWLKKFITVGARAHGSLNIDDNDLLALPVPLPRGKQSLKEQQKIADCLASLDELITLEAQKLDTLKTHKKGLMQKLFPAEGETLPKLRFPEFRDAGEWKITTLGQIAEFQSGGTPSKGNPAFWNGSFPWVTAKDMKQLFLNDTEDHITTIAVEDGAKLMQAGTLLILTRGMTLLKDIPICILSRRMSFNQDVKALTVIDDVDGRFLAYMMLASKQRLLGLVDIAGHGTGRLDTEKLKTFELMVPHAVEQQRIADCFVDIDDLIAAINQKLAALKTHKNGLMQQLFPMMDEVVA